MRKRAVNLTLPSELLAAARAVDINLSEVLEAALSREVKRRQDDYWRKANADAIDSYNRDIDERGVFGKHVRKS